MLLPISIVRADMKLTVGIVDRFERVSLGQKPLNFKLHSSVLFQNTHTKLESAYLRELSRLLLLLEPGVVSPAQSPTKQSALAICSKGKRVIAESWVVSARCKFDSVTKYYSSNKKEWEDIQEADHVQAYMAKLSAAVTITYCGDQNGSVINNT